MSQKGSVQWSKSLEIIFAYEHDPDNFLVPELTEVEDRVLSLHYYLEKGIKPWEWDHENYSDGNEDMIGKFYPEDLANLEQIDGYINERERRIRKRLKQEQLRQNRRR